MKSALLIVFAKAPVPGKVNTRLIPSMGETAAAALQQQLIEHRMQQFRSNPQYDVELCCAPDQNHAVFQQCRQRYGVQLSAQQGDDLGQRMLAAFKQALQQYRKVVLVGTDAPVVDDQTVRVALDALQDCDVVLQPAEDGGYVLIAMRRLPPQVFDAIDWGGPKVLAQTRARLRAAGVPWKELPTAWDIDEADDYRRYLDWMATA